MPDPFTELLGSGTSQCRVLTDDLRDRTEGRHELREYINAVKAAVATADARDHPSAKAERVAVVAFLRGMDLHRLAERIAAGEHHG